MFPAQSECLNSTAAADSHGANPDAGVYCDGVAAIIGDEGVVTRTGHLIWIPVGGDIPVTTRSVGPGNICRAGQCQRGMERED